MVYLPSAVTALSGLCNVRRGKYQALSWDPTHTLLAMSMVLLDHDNVIWELPQPFPDPLGQECNIDSNDREELSLKVGLICAPTIPYFRVVYGYPSGDGF